MSKLRNYIQVQPLDLDEICTNATLMEVFVPHWAFQEKENAFIGDFKAGSAQQYKRMIEFLAYAATTLPRRSNRQDKPSVLFFMERIPSSMSNDTVAGWRFRLMCQGSSEIDNEVVEEVKQDLLMHNNVKRGQAQVMQRALAGAVGNWDGRFVPLTIGEALRIRIARDARETGTAQVVCF